MSEQQFEQLEGSEYLTPPGQLKPHQVARFLAVVHKYQSSPGEDLSEADQFTLMVDLLEYVQQNTVADPAGWDRFSQGPENFGTVMELVGAYCDAVGKLMPSEARSPQKS